MKELYLGAMAGVIIWQLMCFIFFFITKEDYYKTAEFSLGVPGILLWATSVTMRVVYKIYIKILYSKIIYYTEYYWRDKLGNEKYIRTSILHLYIKKWDLKKYKIGKEFKTMSAIEIDSNPFGYNSKYNWLEIVNKKDTYHYYFTSELSEDYLIEIDENFRK